MKLNLRKSLAVLGILVLAGSASTARPARALTLVPPSLEYSLDAGQSVSGKIKLFNESTAPITVFASVSNFTAKDESGTPNFDFAETATDLASWIDLPQGGLTLNGGDRLEVPITITVPKDAEPGGHYASVFFGTDPSIKSKEGGQVSIRSLIGTLIILRVSGETKEAASLVQFGMDGGKNTLTRLPANMFVRIQNDGNVHIRPEGTIVIKNMFGHASATLTVNEASGAVLPASVRRFDSTWSKTTTSASTGNFFSEIASQWNNFALGSYTATANITYGQSHQSLTRSVTFMVIPWQLLLVELLGIALVVFLVVSGMKHYNAAIIRKASQTGPPTKPR